MNTNKWMKLIKGLVQERPFLYTCFSPHQTQVQGNKKFFLQKFFSYELYFMVGKPGGGSSLKSWHVHHAQQQPFKKHHKNDFILG